MSDSKINVYQVNNPAEGCFRKKSNLCTFYLSNHISEAPRYWNLYDLILPDFLIGFHC